MPSVAMSRAVVTCSGSGRPSIRAKSLPRPAGTTASVPPATDTAPASDESMPSPPTETTTSPRPSAAVTRPAIALGPGE